MAAPALIAGALWTALLVATIPPSPQTSVILLPTEDGRATSVVIRAKGGEQVVSQPYQRASVATNSDDAPRLDQADPETIHAQYKDLFALVPPKPRAFELLFETGGSTLTQASINMLDGIVAEAAAHPGADITVTGYTDTRGSMTDNDALSMRRAEGIRQTLAKRGFPVERIEAAGRGERELAVPTADEVNEPRNRRVVVIVR